MASHNVSLREQAAFEAGIKLGALYHQFTGAPVSLASVDSMERAIEESISLQPFVKDVVVRIDRAVVNTCLNEFGYCELEGRMLDVKVVVEFEGVRVTAGLAYDRELEYPLMRIISVEEK
jgi:hypothetical protein